ncbi:MAG TPA: PAS domain S-box protein, partial [Kofleriaceae bacterium]|nr:PAS domain S-box protein [Kofleriaceae bacterium]
MTKKITETARPRFPALFTSVPILEALVRDSNDAITLQELDGTIVAWNRGAERMYGYTEAEALAMNIVAVTPEADPGTLDYLRVIAHGGEMTSREVRRRAKDGRILDVWLTTTRVVIDDTVLVATTERDVTSRRVQERELRFELDAMAKLHRISALYLGDRSEHSILGEILDAAIEISSAAFGAIQILDPASGDLTIARHCGLSASWIEHWNRVAQRQGIHGTALEHRARVIVEDVARSAMLAGTDALAVHLAAGVRAFQSTPLLDRSGTPIGILSTHYPEPRRPLDRALRMLDLLARQAADVIDRVRSDAALRRSEAIAAGILAVSADAIISIDEDMTIRQWNPAAEAMFGYSQAEALGAPLGMLIPERCRLGHREKIVAFAAEPAAVRAMDHRVTAGLRANGEEFPISAMVSKFAIDGETLMTAAVRDVTEARRTEDEQLLLAELGRAFAPADLDATLHDVAGVVVARLADFSTVFVEHDGELQRVAVASHDPALAGCANRVMEIPPVPRPEHPVWTAFESRSTVAQELDRERYAALAHSPDHLAALQVGRPRSALYVPCVVGMMCRGVLGLMSRSRVFQPRDVRLAEEIAWRCALYLENARLHRVEHQAVQARDELLGIVAHDLRSPLNTIALHAELLRLRDDTGSSDVIFRTVQRMTRIIGDLLDVTRLDAGRFVVERVHVPAATLVASAADSLAPQIEARALALRRDVPDSLPVVSADPQRIQQVFDNLVGNAIKFTKHGTIAIGARALDGEV